VGVYVGRTLDSELEGQWFKSYLKQLSFSLIIYIDTVCPYLTFCGF